MEYQGGGCLPDSASDWSNVRSPSFAEARRSLGPQLSMREAVPAGGRRREFSTRAELFEVQIVCFRPVPLTRPMSSAARQKIDDGAGRRGPDSERYSALRSNAPQHLPHCAPLPSPAPGRHRQAGEISHWPPPRVCRHAFIDKGVTAAFYQIHGKLSVSLQCYPYLLVNIRPDSPTAGVHAVLPTWSSRRSVQSICRV